MNEYFLVVVEISLTDHAVAVELIRSGHSLSLTKKLLDYQSLRPDQTELCLYEVINTVCDEFRIWAEIDQKNTLSMFRMKVGVQYFLSVLNTGNIYETLQFCYSPLYSDPKKSNSMLGLFELDDVLLRIKADSEPRFSICVADDYEEILRGSISSVSIN